MDSRERCKTAMRGGVPDRVPVIPQICHPHAALALGRDFRETMIEAVRKPRLVDELQVECARMYGVDGVRVWIPPDPIHDLVDDGENVWQTDAKSGAKIGRIDFQGGGWVVPLVEQVVLKTDEDIDKLPVVSADELLRTEKFQQMAEIVKDARRDLFVISAPPACSVEYVTFMRGKQQALVDLMDRPDFIRRMLDKATDIAIETGTALARVGVDALLLGETFGGVIGPRLFEEFCVPYFKRFVAAMTPYDVLIYLHVCGNSTRLFELMADTGIDCFEPLDPLGGVSVADAKRRVGGRVALMGGVSTLALARGTLEEVQRECSRCLGEGAPGGGYLLACGDMLPTETSREKVEAMVAAAHAYTY